MTYAVAVVQADKVHRPSTPIADDVPYSEVLKDRQGALASPLSAVITRNLSEKAQTSAGVSYLYQVDRVLTTRRHIPYLL